MATYVVGDIQGCFSSLLKLLSAVNFCWGKDTLWVCGDLVNRGPDSLNTVRYLYEHRANVQIVLGNHDLHLLAVAEGSQSIKRKDNFEQLLLPENQDLIQWLRHQPLAYYDEQYKTLMVHAGVPVHWSLKKLLSCAQEVETALQNKAQRRRFFDAM